MTIEELEKQIVLLQAKVARLEGFQMGFSDGTMANIKELMIRLDWLESRPPKKDKVK